MPKETTPKTQPGETVQSTIAKLIDSVQQRYADEWIVEGLVKRITELELRVAVIEAGRIAELERKVAALEAGADMLTPIVAGLTAEMYQEDDMSEGLILNVSQVAKVLGVSRPTVYRLVESGALPAKKLSTGSDTTARTVVLSEDLKAFLTGLPDATAGSDNMTVDVHVEDARQPRADFSHPVDLTVDLTPDVAVRRGPRKL